MLSADNATMDVDLKDLDDKLLHYHQEMIKFQQAAPESRIGPGRVLTTMLQLEQPNGIVDVQTWLRMNMVESTSTDLSLSLYPFMYSAPTNLENKLAYLTLENTKAFDLSELNLPTSDSRPRLPNFSDFSICQRLNIKPRIPTPPPPIQPVYQPPIQPVYQPPIQPVYQPPIQPVYQPPAQPVYQPPHEDVKVRPGLRNNAFSEDKIVKPDTRKRQTPEGDFVTAREQLDKEEAQSGYKTANGKSVGGDRKRSKFTPPLAKEESGGGGEYGYYNLSGGVKAPGLSNRRPTEKDSKPIPNHKKPDPSNKPTDDRLKNLDPQMVEMIQNEMIDPQTNKVGWDDIAGLEHAKASIKEAIIWPMLRPDIFTGLRGPPKGVLLFGPPGTGKTLIAKAIAAQCQTSFFSISSSSLTSKWVGEGEKMVRALFAVARVHQPAVIFMDEIDSLLCKRTEGENDAARKIKTEFLVQFDGCGTDANDRILIIGATNRPGELDDAARRRFRKKLYIPLPDFEARLALFKNLLKKERNSLSDEQMHEIAKLTEGYSGSDCDNLCRDAALGPIRDLQGMDVVNMNIDSVEPISLHHLIDAMKQIKPSVSAADLDDYLKYEQEFGSNR